MNWCRHPVVLPVHIKCSLISLHELSEVYFWNRNPHWVLVLVVYWISPRFMQIHLNSVLPSLLTSSLLKEARTTLATAKTEEGFLRILTFTAASSHAIFHNLHLMETQPVSFTVLTVVVAVCLCGFQLVNLKDSAPSLKSHSETFQNVETWKL